MFSNYTVLCIHVIINSTALAKRVIGHICLMTYFKSNNHINATIITPKMLSKLTYFYIYLDRETINYIFIIDTNILFSSWLRDWLYMPFASAEDK